MKSRKTMLLVAGTVFCGVAVLADNTIYQNDFSTRESAEPIPAYGVVHEAQPYALEKTPLCFVPESSTGYSGNDAAAIARMADPSAYTAKAVSGTDRPNYDGWFTPYFIKANNTQFKIFPTVVKDNGNPCFTWYRSNAKAVKGVALQPLHNTFTNGLLRVYVDMRPPATWVDQSKLYYTRIFPVTEKYMDVRGWDGAMNVDKMPGRVGFGSAKN